MLPVDFQVMSAAKFLVTKAKAQSVNETYL